MVKDKGQKSSVVGVIHARGGSKRIPLKNMVLLAGKPLIYYMVKAALGSKCLDRVIVSTDHPAIRDASLSFGAEVPFVRPPKLSEDCPSEWVTQHAVEFIEAEESNKIDIAVTMQPTTPFCLSSDIDACVEILKSDAKLGSVFSAKVSHDRPEWMFYLKDNYRAELLLGGEIKGERGICQSLPKLVLPNGGIYATRRDALFSEGVIISGKTGAYVMPSERSIDIDEPIDLKYAECIMLKKKAI